MALRAAEWEGAGRQGAALPRGGAADRVRRFAPGRLGPGRPSGCVGM